MGLPMKIVGKTFGRLTVLGRDLSKYGTGTFWICKCSCGTTGSFRGKSLVSGNTQSCGCLQREVRASNGKQNVKHGRGSSQKGRRDKTYAAWFCMKSRCQRTADLEYQRYGGRGVTVCARWQDFQKFFSDMGECPPEHTLDRKDPWGNYEPGNCRWATRSQQSQNLRTTRKFLFGETMWSLTELSVAFDVSREKLKYRLCEKSLTVAQALEDIVSG